MDFVKIAEVLFYLECVLTNGSQRESICDGMAIANCQTGTNANLKN